MNKGGKGSFDQVMQGLGYLRDAGVEWNALTTIHAANADPGREVYWGTAHRPFRVTPVRSHDATLVALR